MRQKFFKLSRSRSEDKDVPKIGIMPDNVTINAGKVLTLTATLSSECSVAWLHNDKELSNGDKDGRICLENTTHSSTLTVLDIEYTESGIYTLKVRNSSGLNSSNVTVSVI